MLALECEGFNTSSELEDGFVKQFPERAPSFHGFWLLCFQLITSDLGGTKKKDSKVHRFGFFWKGLPEAYFNYITTNIARIVTAVQCHS